MIKMKLSGHLSGYINSTTKHKVGMTLNTTRVKANLFQM